ncbi:alpha/beta hydrolase fold domain-containing protein [Rhodococcus sp. IEGM 1366]|uniref:alpha/beta hydrolase fold domain-containing protein n=1 Tax=Rhodococcus sp. IEGM 1366 TaxID=3082223 RepID=UPI002954392A|nr:alpha/beta hydrolase fold domain-containing protein [Rhodococcus sp. IEGM 1366]MDV8070966.1 alpha/beta hydrolase fold domain-containing protein [Rhodococcus sp. IEGM 1366]
MTEADISTTDSRTRVVFDLLDAAGVPILRITPAEAKSDRALIHFHGGGYRKGSPQHFAESVGRIALACQMQIFSVGYRLSTVSPFPAAVDDALVAYQWITEQIRPDRIALWGDSAGGGLAAALLLRLRDLEISSPAGAFLFSPWADLRNTAETYSENSATDDLFSLTQAIEAAESYLAGHPATDPLASPVLGSWSNQPRLVVQVSDAEVLYGDGVLLAQTAAAAGTDVRLKIHKGMPHIWNLAYPSTPSSKEAISYMIENLHELFDSNIETG